MHRFAQDLASSLKLSLYLRFHTTENDRYMCVRACVRACVLAWCASVMENHTQLLRCYHLTFTVYKTLNTFFKQLNVPLSLQCPVSISPQAPRGPNPLHYLKLKKNCLVVGLIRHYLSIRQGAAHGLTRHNCDEGYLNESNQLCGAERDNPHCATDVIKLYVVMLSKHQPVSRASTPDVCRYAVCR